MLVFFIIEALSINDDIFYLLSTGSCGESLTYSIEGEKIIISGNGLMNNYNSNNLIIIYF